MCRKRGARRRRERIDQLAEQGPWLGGPRRRRQGCPRGEARAATSGVAAPSTDEHHLMRLIHRHDFLDRAGEGQPGRAHLDQAGRRDHLVAQRLRGITAAAPPGSGPGSGRACDRPGGSARRARSAASRRTRPGVAATNCSSSCSTSSSHSLVVHCVRRQRWPSASRRHNPCSAQIRRRDEIEPAIHQLVIEAAQHVHRDAGPHGEIAEQLQQLRVGPGPGGVLRVLDQHAFERQDE